MKGIVPYVSIRRPTFCTVKTAPYGVIYNVSPGCRSKRVGPHFQLNIVGCS